MPNNPIYTTKLETKVKQILETSPATRENDHTLVAHYWASETIHEGPLRIESAKVFLQLLATGILTKYSSISRARRKIQEKHVDLRGKSYNIRQNKAKKAIKHFGNKII